jgi:hypothetical protein
LLRGDVQLESNATLGVKSGKPHPDAVIEGEILEPYTNKLGSLQEKPVGTFEADLLEVLDDMEKL